MPSRTITVAAWLVIAAMAFNLVRAADALASLPLAKARAATVRRDLIAVAARTARHGRDRLTLRLPQHWHRERERGSTSSKPPAGHPPQRPDQPRTRSAPPTPPGSQPPSPKPKAPDKPQNRHRQAKHALKALIDENAKH
jgi:hypothetical protein